MQLSISRVVYIRDSLLRRRDVTGAFTMLIGLGLFARTTFREGEKTIFFVGELFTNLDEFDEERAGQKPYILHSKKADEYGTGEWLEHKINALPQFPTVPLPALKRLLKEWRKQTVD